MAPSKILANDKHSFLFCQSIMTKKKILYNIATRGLYPKIFTAVINAAPQKAGAFVTVSYIHPSLKFADKFGEEGSYPLRQILD
jgi:hypothetical protein